MAYDVDLAGRLRPLVAEVGRSGVGRGEADVRRARVPGGGKHGRGRQRTRRGDGAGGPGEREALLARPGVDVVEMGGGREMRGWVRVHTDGLDDDTLRAWVQRGLAAAELERD